jgi:hypothetical protein
VVSLNLNFDQLNHFGTWEGEFDFVSVASCERAVVDSVLTGGAEGARILSSPSIMDNLSINFESESDK